MTTQTYGPVYPTGTITTSTYSSDYAVFTESGNLTGLYSTREEAETALGHYRAQVAAAGPEAMKDTRPCACCAKYCHIGDAYCENCGHKLYDIYDAILAWTPDPSSVRITAKMSGAALAREVRHVLKSLPVPTRVKTRDGYYVRVTIEDDTSARWLADHNRNNWTMDWHHDGAQRISARQNGRRAMEATRHLETQLHRLFEGTAGTVDHSPGADYHYATLPLISVH